MSPGIASALVLIGLCFWPFLNLASHNRNQLDLESFTLLLAVPAVLASLAVLAVKLAKLAFRRASEAGLAIGLAAATVLFFNYHAIFGQLYALGAPRVNYLYLALAVLVPLLAYRLGMTAAAPGVALVFAATVVVLPAGNLLVYALTYRPALGKPPAEAKTAAPGAFERRNVYYVIADGYAREDQLKKVLGFDNRPAMDFLRAHGFYVADRAYANYPLTFLSVSSSFSGDYLVQDGEAFYGRARFYELLRGNNATVNRFKAQGYAYIHAPSSLWSGSDCAGYEDRCLEMQNRPYGSLELTNLIVDLTPARLVYRKLVPAPAPPMNFSFLRQQLSAILWRRERPLLVFAHTFPPHPPWVYHPDCAAKPDRTYDVYNAWTEKARRLYLDNLECANRQMSEFVSFIVARDPEAIVVIQSDHGTAFTINWKKAPELWSAQEFDERFGILMAVRAPEKCTQWLAPDLSAVNVFAFVFACLEGRAPLYQRNTHYLVTEGETESVPGTAKRYPHR